MNDEKYAPKYTNSDCSFTQRPLLVHLEKRFWSDRRCVPRLTLVLHGCDIANTPCTHQHIEMDRTVTDYIKYFNGNFRITSPRVYTNFRTLTSPSLCNLVHILKFTILGFFVSSYCLFKTNVSVKLAIMLCIGLQTKAASLLLSCFTLNLSLI